MTDSENSYADSALFIGLVTTPVDKMVKDFFIQEFTDTEDQVSLFTRYKEGLIQYSSNDDEQRLEEEKQLKHYYVPQGFCLFGNSDLAILALVDDFSFGNQLFHPNHQFKSNHAYSKYYYDYQTITGYTPLSSLCDKINLEKKWEKLFTSEEKKLPLIGITRIKVTSSLLIGVGKSILAVIGEIFRHEKNRINENAGNKLDYLLIESFCSYEFTLITFSNSFNLITEFLIKIREYDLKALKEIIPPNNQSYLNSLKSIESNSLSMLWIDMHSGTYDKNKLLFNTHIFTKTETTFGYSVDFLDNQRDFHSINNDSTIKYLLKFDIKPGHLQSFLQNINPHIEKFSNESVATGHSLVSYEFADLNNNLPIPNLYKIIEIKKPHQEALISGNHFFQNLNKINTSFSLNTSQKFKLAEIGTIAEEHLRITEILRHYIFSNQVLANLNKWLKELGISKVLQSRVQKMYGNFNDGIQDPVLYSYFVELKSYLDQVYTIVEEWYKANDNDSNEKKHNILSKLIDNFESGFKNRFHQTYLESNITDYNLEYSGGLHQIISGYDAFYKVIRSGFDFDFKNNSIVFVSGDAGVCSDAYSLRINYYHLYNIQHFLCLITKEASNFYIPGDNSIKDESKTESESRKKVFSNFRPNNDSYKEILEIRKEIYHELFNTNSLDGERSKYYWFFYTSTNIDLFSYLFSDYASYGYSFLNDFDLLLFWYQSVYFQMPVFYKKDKTLAEEEYCLFALRLTILKKMTKTQIKIDKYLEVSSCYNLDQIRRINNFVSDFADILIVNEKFNSWYLKTQEELNFLFLNMKNKFVQKIIMDSNFSNSLRDEDLKMLRIKIKDNLLERIKESGNLLINNIEKGRLTEFPNDSDYSVFVLGCIYGVLKKLKELNLNKISILEHGINGEPNSPNTDIKILIDPSGGTFIRGHQNRKEYFKIRCSIINTLIDFSLKWKKDNFIQE